MDGEEEIGLEGHAPGGRLETQVLEDLPLVRLDVDFIAVEVIVVVITIFVVTVGVAVSVGLDEFARVRGTRQNESTLE